MKMFDAGKTRMIGLTYGEKAMTIRGGATVLKVGGGQFCERSEPKKCFDPPLFGQWGEVLGTGQPLGGLGSAVSFLSGVRGGSSPGR